MDVRHPYIFSRSLQAPLELTPRPSAETSRRLLDPAWHPALEVLSLGSRGGGSTRTCRRTSKGRKKAEMQPIRSRCPVPQRAKAGWPHHECGPKGSAWWDFHVLKGGMGWDHGAHCEVKRKKLKKKKEESTSYSRWGPTYAPWTAARVTSAGCRKVSSQVLSTPRNHEPRIWWWMLSFVCGL